MNAPLALHITADDYGLHPAVNRGIERLAGRGCVTGVSVMTHPDASLADVGRLRDTGVRCGLHLVFVEERPVEDPGRLPGLVDAHGRLPRSYRHLMAALTRAPWIARAMAREAAAQLSRYRSLGLPLDFINSHQHVHLLPPVWWALRPLLADLPGVDVRSAHTLPVLASADGAVAASSRVCWATAPLAARTVLAPRGIAHAGGMTAGVARAILASIAATHGVPDVQGEIVLHPGDEDDELRRRYGHWRYDWLGEARVAERISREQELAAFGLVLARRDDGASVT